MSTSLIISLARVMTMALVSVLFSAPVCASTPVRWEQLRQPYFQQLFTDATPLEDQIDVVSQDKAGFIWLLSGTRLWRWDAYQFAAATVAKGESVPIVLTIASDPTGANWAGTAEGLFRIVPGTTRLKREKVAAFDSLSINYMVFDFSGGRRRAFLASVNRVFEWDMRTRAVRSYGIGGGASNRVHALHLDGQGSLWVGTTEGLLHKSVSGAPDDSLHHVQGWPANTRVASILTDHEKRLWIGTTISGLYYLDRDGQFKVVDLPTPDGNLPWIYCMAEIRPGVLWFGTFGKGILEFEVGRKSFKPIRHDRLLASSLADDNVWTMFRDDRGLVWVGGDHSLNLYDTTQTAIEHVPGDIGAGGLSDARVHSILAMPDGSLWLGTGGHGIDIVDPLRPEVGRIAAGMPTGGGTRLSTDPIEALALADPASVLASSNWLTVAIDRSSRAARVLRPVGRASDAFTSAFARYGDSTWLGGTDGLWRVPNAWSEQATNVLSSWYGELRVSSLLADGTQLWVGTWNGLTRLQEGPEPAREVSIRRIDAAQINRQFIASMAIDLQKRLWLATTSGGLFFKSRDQVDSKSTWGNLTQAEGLPANNVTSVVVDDDGGIWASTSRGIAFVDPKSLDVTSLLPDQGAAAAPYIRASGAKDAAGEILFGGLAGLTIIQPRAWHPPSFNPRVVLTNIESDAGHTLLPQVRRNGDGSTATELFVPPDTKRLTIEFAALDYVSAVRIRYRYRLLGYDPHWRETDAAHRTASFTSLPPDAYELQVQASLDGRHWRDAGLAIKVDVAPASYQKTWFRVTAALAIVLLLTAAYQWRTRLFRQQQAVLEQKVLERTEELSQANMQLREKSTVIEQLSLTDPLTGLRNRRFLTQNIEADVSLALRRHYDHLAAPTSSLENVDLIFFLVDIDFFKRINDQWGHAAGDDVLVELRRRLMTVFRDFDYLIRWGGEEFLAVARDTSRETGSLIAERIRQAVASDTFDLGNGSRIAVTCSIGFAPFPFVSTRPDALTWSETVAIADAALYRAKHDGRNTWVGFDSAGDGISDQQIAEMRRSAESALQLDSLKSGSAGET